MVSCFSASPIAFGVYDPDEQFRDYSVLLEQVFLPWRLNDTTELEAALSKVLVKNRFPLVSLEPWSWNWNGMTDASLLADVAAGKYDSTLLQSFAVIAAASPQPIFLRWGHEMEIVGQYPWSSANAKDYIAAYRHVVSLARQQHVPNIHWVWSPAGNVELKHYWPGEDYVDLIGISIYAHRAWNPRSFEQIPSFRRLIAEKYPRVARYGKPIIIAEMGVAGTAEEQARWLIHALEQARHIPNLKAVLYFNQAQPPIVPLSIGLPRWDLNEAQVQEVMTHWQLLNNNRVTAANIDVFLTAQ